MAKPAPSKLNCNPDVDEVIEIVPAGLEQVGGVTVVVGVGGGTGFAVAGALGKLVHPLRVWVAVKVPELSSLGLSVLPSFQRRLPENPEAAIELVLQLLVTNN